MNAVVTKSGNVVERQYQGMSFKFREDGYFNMTHAAKHFNKRVDKFLAAQDTEDYMDALIEAFSNSPSEGELEFRLVEAHAGRYGGSWAHPKLATFFARWLDPKFAVFCDMVIDDLTHGYSVLKV